MPLGTQLGPKMHQIEPKMATKSSKMSQQGRQDDHLELNLALPEWFQKHFATLGQTSWL
jgi:hypothetical protein